MRLAGLPIAEPAAGIAAYRKERTLALTRSPECWENFDRYQKAKRGIQLDYLPIKMDFENVSRCNFKCVMCQVTEWHKGKRADDMSVADFKRLIDENYGLLEIKLQGLGEPMMGGDAMFEMIRYARSKHIWVRTATNASLLHLKDNYRKLIDSDVNEVQISIDGSTKDVFEHIRKGSSFQRVLNNCNLINEYQREKGVTRTKMWVAVQSTNQHQLEDLVDLAASLGFTNMVFGLDLSDWGTERWREKNGAIDVEDDLDIDRLEGLVRRGLRNGVQVMFWHAMAKYTREKPCQWPFERMFVSSDLKAVPCCIICNPETLNLGSVDDGLAVVWAGEQYQNFRQAHLDGNIPKPCQGCYQ